ncbi:hypothetical protein GKC28_02305 [Leisingera sp. ANG59]|nr:hypothetical protein [Leisingera sp. ANG59]
MTLFGSVSKCYPVFVIFFRESPEKGKTPLDGAGGGEYYSPTFSSDAGCAAGGCSSVG